MYKVYLHRKKSNGQLFYVGISSNKRRPNRVDNRNPIWTNIYNKHGRTVEIIADNLSQKDACELEKFIIKLFGRRDLGTGCLANMCNGGEINTGMIPHNRKRIGKFTKEGKLIEVFSCEREARTRENAGKGSIPKACRKERKTYRGFVWNYINYKNKILSE